MTAELRAERRGTTLILTLSHPALGNTLSNQVIDAGIEALAVAESDPALRCVILTGADRQFCAGDDIRQLAAQRHTGADTGPAVQARQIERFHDWIEALRTFAKPVIAAVEGHARGSGCALTLACDLLVAADNACFSLPQSLMGLTPTGGALWHVLQTLPRPRVQRLLWLGESLSAHELHTLGWIDRLSAPGEALALALQRAEQLAALPAPMLGSLKELINQAHGATLRAHLNCERDHLINNLGQPHAGEGLHAWLEQRAPRFVE